jgi:hypothetical protein
MYMTKRPVAGHRMTFGRSPMRPGPSGPSGCTGSTMPSNVQAPRSVEDQQPNPSNLFSLSVLCSPNR